MQGVINATALAIVLAFVVPGYIIGAVRSVFLTGRRKIRSEAQLFEALALSAANLAFCYPLVAFLLDRAGTSTWLVQMSWLFVLILVPGLTGILLGISARRGWSQIALRGVGLAPVHPMPTAWDWKFAKCEPCWVEVTLTDGTKFAGYCGSQSFISSDPSERDFYIEAAFEIDENERWHRKDSGVYIAHGQVSTIECWPVTKPQESNDYATPEEPEPRQQGLPASIGALATADAA